jgi:hypothetical protein
MTDFEEEMIQVCVDCASIPEYNGGTAFTQWELEFLESINEQNMPLTEKQAYILQKLYDRC